MHRQYRRHSQKVASSCHQIRAKRHNLSQGCPLGFTHSQPQTTPWIYPMPRRLLLLTIFLTLLLTACNANDTTSSQHFHAKATLTSVTPTSSTKTSSTKPPTTTSTEPQDSTPQDVAPEPNNIAAPEPAATYDEPYFIQCFAQYPGYALWSDNSSRYSQWCADTMGVSAPTNTGNSYSNTYNYVDPEPIPTFAHNSGDGYGPNQKLPPLCARFPSDYGPC